jgi:hypothetical protein
MSTHSDSTNADGLRALTSAELHEVAGGAMLDHLKETMQRHTRMYEALASILGGMNDDNRSDVRNVRI